MNLTEHQWQVVIFCVVCYTMAACFWMAGRFKHRSRRLEIAKQLLARAEIEQKRAYISLSKLDFEDADFRVKEMSALIEEARQIQEEPWP